MINCIHTEWCPGHDVKLHPHLDCYARIPAFDKDADSESDTTWHV